MKRYSKLALSALLLALTLSLASCDGGASQGSDQNAGSGDAGAGSTGAREKTTQPAERTTEEASGMDGMNGMGDMEGMDHGPSGARTMLMEDGEYSDERFVDSMVPHHRGAVDMARVALLLGQPGVRAARRRGRSLPS